MIKPQKSALKLWLSICITGIFGYLMLYADNFKTDINQIEVSAEFVAPVEQDTSAININDIIVDADKEGMLTYIVKNGDTLSDIAQKFATTINNIKKVNNIRGTKVNPGQKLTITDVEGIIYPMKQTTNLIVFANQYDLDLEDLKNLNYIQNNNQEIQQGDEIFIPITEKQAIEKGLIEKNEDPLPPLNKPKPKTPSKIVKTANGGIKLTQSNTDTNDDNTDDGKKKNLVAKWVYRSNISNGFYQGFCTWYAAIKRPDIFKFTAENRQDRPFGGNAREWLKNAEKAGLTIGNKPKKGSLAIFRSGGPGYRTAGHVGIVIDIDKENNRILLEDMNYYGKFIVSQRYIAMNDDMTSDDSGNLMGYIY